jgi:hypothetical protein
VQPAAGKAVLKSLLRDVVGRAEQGEAAWTSQLTPAARVAALRLLVTIGADRLRAQ